MVMQDFQDNLGGWPSFAPPPTGAAPPFALFERWAPRTFDRDDRERGNASERKFPHVGGKNSQPSNLAKAGAADSW